MNSGGKKLVPACPNPCSGCGGAERKMLARKIDESHFQLAFLSRKGERTEGKRFTAAEELSMLNGDDGTLRHSQFRTEEQQVKFLLLLIAVAGLYNSMGERREDTRKNCKTPTGSVGRGFASEACGPFVLSVSLAGTQWCNSYSL